MRDEASTRVDLWSPGSPTCCWPPFLGGAEEEGRSVWGWGSTDLPPPNCVTTGIAWTV